MCEDKSISLVNLGKLSKPADTLINRVSDAVGVLFAPRQIKRIAKAEAEASLTEAETQIKISALHRRAMLRFVEEEAKRQNNMENITLKALPHLDDKGDHDQIEDDWITNFFDKCRIISDEEMQNLWSKILAGEANVNGTFSTRTVNCLADLDKTDAELFSDLCGFGLTIGEFVPLVFDVNAAIYNDRGITFGSLSHLESIGLILFDNLAKLQKQVNLKVATLTYYDQDLELTFEKLYDNPLEIGKVALTRVGQELAPICGGQPVAGFMDYVKEKWKKHLPGRNID